MRPFNDALHLNEHFGSTRRQRGNIGRNFTVRKSVSIQCLVPRLVIEASKSVGQVIQRRREPRTVIGYLRGDIEQLRRSAEALRQAPQYARYGIHP